MIAAPTVTAYIALGSNIGDRAATILRALTLLSEQSGIDVSLVSQLIETQPVGGPPQQNNYLNAAAELRCTVTPEQLLHTLQQIEKLLGRQRPAPHAPRTIDLDILLFGSDIIDLPHLRIPHPRLHQRRFVLDPLVEIAPDAIHPEFNLTIRQLRDNLEKS